MNALVFGEANPADYMEPVCYECKHVRSEHYDGNGTPGLDLPCWEGWTESEEGCECMGFITQPVSQVDMKALLP